MQIHANAQSAKSSKFKCPEWLLKGSADMPLCPEGNGQMLLPETYPVAAIVVSDVGMGGMDADFTSDVVIKALVGSGKNNPLVVLPVSDDTMKKLNAKIDSLKVDSATKTRWKQSLKQVPVKGYTWQQDYMQPFVDSKTGRVVTREVQGYRRHGESYQNVTKAIAACGITSGGMLTADENVSGHSGGNIEALPGGICLLGNDGFRSDNEWDKYAKQICHGDEDDRIKVPTAWLMVGHTDEVIKVIRNKNQKAPCDFAVAVASPEKALELLRQNPQDDFLDFTEGRGGKPSELRARRTAHDRGISSICRSHVFMKLNNAPVRQKRDESDKSKGISWLFNQENWILNFAHAGAIVAKRNSSETETDCDDLTNAAAYKLFSEEKELKEYNTLVQSKMNSLKVEVAKNLKKKFPSCNIDIFDVPDLFYGGAVVEEPGGKELPASIGNSVLPNPTNSISINNTIISPDPSNSAFKKYLTEEYKKRGLESKFVDTFEYAHMGMGNLHCSTNTMHMCKPRSGK